MGSNMNGKLGIGASHGQVTHSSIPTLVQNLKNVLKVACGHSHTLAIDQDGVAYSWGQQKYGALGLGPVDTEMDISSPKVVTSLLPEVIFDIAAGSRHSIFIS